MAITRRATAHTPPPQPGPSPTTTTPPRDDRTGDDPTGRSPLAQIEARVQHRAKQTHLDLDQPDGETRLAQLIDDEITAWQDDHKRGIHPIEIADPASVAERAIRNIAHYGPLTPLLADDDVWEIMINAPDGALA